MFEHHRQPLLPRSVFYARVAQAASIGLSIIIVSLGLGMGGYRILEKMTWLDAFVNAAMILSGMGPIAPLHTSGGKLFAGCYALFSGLAVITSTGVIFVPVFHRFLHKFHLETHGPGKNPP